MPTYAIISVVIVSYSLDDFFSLIRLFDLPKVQKVSSVKCRTGVELSGPTSNYTHTHTHCTLETMLTQQNTFLIFFSFIQNSLILFKASKPEEEKRKKKV